MRFAQIGIQQVPGPLHEGNGTRQLIINEEATPNQRTALMAMYSGTQGGAIFEALAAINPNQLETMFAPITLEINRERRRTTLHIPDILEIRTEPIKNPVSGEEHRARIVLPDGFEFKEAEMANATYLRARSGNQEFQYADVYAQLNEFDWSNA